MSRMDYLSQQMRAREADVMRLMTMQEQLREEMKRMRAQKVTAADQLVFERQAHEEKMTNMQQQIQSLAKANEDLRAAMETTDKDLEKAKRTYAELQSRVASGQSAPPAGAMAGTEASFRARATSRSSVSNLPGRAAPISLQDDSGPPEGATGGIMPSSSPAGAPARRAPPKRAVG